MWSKLWDELIKSIATVYADIAKNWLAFLTIFVIYTIIVVILTSQYYKHLNENVKYDKELLEKQKKEYRELKKEHEKYKKEIDSPNYQAYLAAKNIDKDNLSDKDMFVRK